MFKNIGNFLKSQFGGFTLKALSDAEKSDVSELKKYLNAAYKSCGEEVKNKDEIKPVFVSLVSDLASAPSFHELKLTKGFADDNSFVNFSVASAEKWFEYSEKVKGSKKVAEKASEKKAVTKSVDVSTYLKPRTPRTLVQ